MLTIAIPGVPKGKGRPRFNRAGGRAYTPQATRTYEAIISFYGRKAMAYRPLLDGMLEVSLYAVFPVPASASKARKARMLAGNERPTKKPDFDNIAKVVDGLNGIVWRDDASIVDGGVYKYYGERPGLVIKVAPAVPAAAPDYVNAALATFSLDE